ncbi:hypothetical protein ACFL2Q_18050 [Thermodesulfobacteriota bacterium]
MAPAMGSYGYYCPSPDCYGVHPSLYVGYLFHDKGVDLSFSEPDTDAQTIQDLRQDYDIGGVWLEFVVPFQGVAPYGMVLGCSLLVATENTSEETLLNTTGGEVVRSWQGDPEWGQVQLALTYRFRPAFTGVAGFRYDNFQTRFYATTRELTDPEVPEDRADLTLSNYLPFLGMEFNRCVPDRNISIRAGVIGFPIALGSMDYSEAATAGIIVGGAQTPVFPASNSFSQGYFVEFYGALSSAFSHGVELGAFAKYSINGARGSVDVGDGNASIDTTAYTFDFERKTLIVGGSATVSF